MRRPKPARPLACALLLPLAVSSVLANDAPASTEPDTLAVPAFSLPASNFLSPEARRLKAQPDVWSAVRQCTRRRIDAAHLQPKDEVGTMLDAEREFGRCADQLYFEPLLQKQQQAFTAETRTRTIAGVKVEEFTPRDGIAPANKNRMLLNLHGGGFKSGAVLGGRIESLPIATLGRIRVVSVDYRQGPDHRFPAASDDVVAVYRELLKTYDARNIGIYGCSAGGTLTGQVLRKLIVDGLPTPGAAGMFCAGAYLPSGDSFRIGSTLFDVRSPPQPGDPPASHSYFRGVDRNDPALAPGNDPATLRCFPPTLLISASRDTAMSAAIHTHTEFMRLGVPARLAVWEGLDHAFFYDPELPESREVYATVLRFFEEFLGRKSAARCQ